MLAMNPNAPGTWRFKLLGVPVAVHWIFWVLAAMLGGAFSVNSPLQFQLLLVWVAVVFVSILVHEFGHAFAFRRYGGQPSILLYGMGGLAWATGRYTRNQSIVITLGGPMIQLALAVPFFLWLQTLPMVERDGRSLYAGESIHLYYFVWSMVRVNIIWAVLNLLPILPLDGGRLLEHIMRGRRAQLRGKIGAACAIAIGVGMMFYPPTRHPFNLLIFGFLAYANWQAANPQRQFR